VLSTADALLLAEVYAAGEAPIVAADGRSLARAVRVAGKVEPLFVEDIAELAEAIRRTARDGDVVVIMGAERTWTTCRRSCASCRPRSRCSSSAWAPTCWCVMAAGAAPWS
jgi:UDP-N-acetylmuramate-alanine ligase